MPVKVSQVIVLYLYTRYPIVARALGLAAAVQPLGRVRRASKGILHTSLVYKIPYRRARAWPSASREQRYLAYK